jgi:NAD(P)-dependent dehydrogenase (short-subunit alcohol dehydrogenase family)
MWDFSGKAIFVSGAGRGLGRSAAVYLAGMGATLGVADIDGEGARETADLIEGAGGTAHTYAGDLADRDVFLAAAAEFAAKAGRIDAMLNNAAYLVYEPVENIRPETLDRMIGAGFKSAIWGCQALLAHYDPARGGAIVNYSSPVAYKGFPTTSAYSAIKSAVTGLTRTLAAELGPRNVRVNAVAPASVPTPGAIGIVTKEEYARRAATIPLRRIGREEDNNYAVAFLLSDQASFINGEVLHVDGGVVAAG